MKWQEKYASKLVTASEAVSHVKSGDKVIFGDWIAEPPALADALVARAPELENVEIIHGISPGKLEYIKPEYEGIFHHTAVFLEKRTAAAYREGRIDYIGGTNFHEWPTMFRVSEKLNPHWAFIMLAEPDEDGYCSFGYDCSFTFPAADTATLGVIAQINPKMPQVGGQKIHVDDIDWLVDAETPLHIIPKAEASPKIQTIADYCAELVQDGATLQFGIGALPDAIARNLTSKKHLGVHSETLTTALMDLVKAGALDNSMKTINRGVCIGAQAAGTQEFYDFIDGNPMFEVHPVNYVNDPLVIGQNYRQTSVNSCMEVDLKGQVNSETVNGYQVTGIGGQLDHVRGAQLSEGGISILALNSTAKNDTISKIVLDFAPCNVTTVPRYDVQYIVTEYGVANMKYKTERERARALINIAHPKFREQLEFDAKKMCLL